jgi:hypothetical protein
LQSAEPFQLAVFGLGSDQFAICLILILYNTGVLLITGHAFFLSQQQSSLTDVIHIALEHYRQSGKGDMIAHAIQAEFDGAKDVDNSTANEFYDDGLGMALCTIAFNNLLGELLICSCLKFRIY